MGNAAGPAVKEETMSDFTFKPAAREAVPLLLGLIGQSGSGKTYSAMRIAAGIVGKGNKFAVIDTESRRALHYADKFKDQYDHCPFEPPFTPERYAEAIRAADKAGYKAIVVDSMSHEWAGEGGVLDWQEEELTRMAGDDWRKRETCKMAAWIKPKMAHKQMVSRLLQVKSHLILCFRAEDKVKMEKDEKGKMQIVPIGLQPICSKEMPYELMASFMLNSDKPGYPIPLKLQEQHKAMFPLDKLLNEESGALIAAWARGGATPPAPKPEDLTEEAKAFSNKCKGKDLSDNDIKEFKMYLFKTPPTKAELRAVIDGFNDKYDEWVGTKIKKTGS